MASEPRVPTRLSADRRRPVRTLPRSGRVLRAGLALGVVASTLAACGRPNALGEENSLILVADPAVWSGIEQPTYDALETTLFTTRDEKKFNVTHVAPGSNELDHLLLWRQVIILGTPGDPLLQRVADAARRELPAPPGFFRVPNVWATGQAVTAVVLEPGREAASWEALLPELSAILDREYRDWALNRMFVSGVDSALVDTLRARLGFTLEVPRVYEHVFRDDDIVLIRNDNPDPAELIRSILVQRRPAADSLSAFGFAEWRAGIDSVQYNVPQGFELLREAPAPLELGGATGIEVRGTWRDEAAYPAGGLFLGRVLRCPAATYFVDAWLYSPNPRRSKWQFVMQMEEILNSFACASP